jgi:uncharacterized damage-inducible protein DinB
MAKDTWVDRTFDFDFDFTTYPKFIERLETTPNMLDLLILSIPENIYTVKHGKEWSIQENVGHLLTVDDLFIGRLDDYENGASELRPADVSGARTDRANYNSDDMKKLLEEFRDKRRIFIARLKKMEREMFKKVSWHPRLNKPMRLCDMLYFQAEHDDHHLNKIRFIEEKIHEAT